MLIFFFFFKLLSFKAVNFGLIQSIWGIWAIENSYSNSGLVLVSNVFCSLFLLKVPPVLGKACGWLLRCNTSLPDLCPPDIAASGDAVSQAGRAGVCFLGLIGTRNVYLC